MRGSTALTSSHANPLSGGPEAALLLACARTDSGDAHTAQVRELAQRPGLDWNRLLELAGRHAVRPLLHQQLQQCSPEAVPASILSRLETESQSNAQRSLHLTAELLSVLRLFEERGIPAIPYKGPVLSSQAYGNLALREFLDLDILLPAEQFRAAREALASAGYQPALKFTPRQERSLLRSNCEYVLDHPERRCTVELHWRIAPKHFAVEFDFEELWARCRRIPMGGSEVSTLADEDLLLVLSVHAAKHLWECLCWTCDLAELVRGRPGLDWEHALLQAEGLGALRFLLISLELSRELFAAELPPAVLEMIARDPEVPALALAVTERMWAGGSSGVSLRDHRLLLRARERWRDRARYIARLVFTPGVSEWSLLELPAPLWPLYPAIRLGRVAGKLLRGLWRPSSSASAPAPAAHFHQNPGPPRA